MRWHPRRQQRRLGFCALAFTRAVSRIGLNPIVTKLSGCVVVCAISTRTRLRHCSLFLLHLAETVHLSVSYCPTAFTGRGGVVSVDPSGAGSFSVVDHGWKWPSAVDSGCPENSDPTVLIDAGHAYLDFTSAWGYITDIDVTKGSVARAIKASSRTDLAFDGFTSFATSDSVSCSVHCAVPVVTREWYVLRRATRSWALRRRPRRRASAATAASSTGHRMPLLAFSRELRVRCSLPMLVQ